MKNGLFFLIYTDYQLTFASIAAPSFLLTSSAWAPHITFNVWIIFQSWCSHKNVFFHSASLSFSHSNLLRNVSSTFNIVFQRGEVFRSLIFLFSYIKYFVALLFTFIFISFNGVTFAFLIFLLFLLSTFLINAP